MKPQLLSAPKVGVRKYTNLSHKQVVVLLKGYKRRKVGVLQHAFDVDEIGRNVYNVTVEFVYFGDAK